jgi:hypothetical protein
MLSSDQNDVYVRFTLGHVAAVVFEVHKLWRQTQPDLYSVEQVYKANG